MGKLSKVVLTLLVLLKQARALNEVFLQALVLKDEIVDVLFVGVESLQGLLVSFE